MIFTPEVAADLFPFLRGKWGKLLYKPCMYLSGIHHVNRIHEAVEQQGIEPGPDFAKALLDQMGLEFMIGNPERLVFPEGPFITISNHVYGHIDGICLVDIVGHVRSRMKVMVNEMLMPIWGLSPNFIAVNPTVNKRETTSTSIGGIKSALQQLGEGEPLSIFPSGAVSDLKPREGWTLQERPWQEAALKFIRKAKVPVVPIRFFDQNSWFYYLLGLLDYRIRFVRLFHEVANKKGTFPRLGIGQTISVEQQEALPDEEFGTFLRKSVYDMPLPEHFIKRSDLWK